jgi:hypothetical protein
MLFYDVRRRPSALGQFFAIVSSLVVSIFRGLADALAESRLARLVVGLGHWAKRPIGTSTSVQGLDYDS